MVQGHQGERISPHQHNILMLAFMAVGMPLFNSNNIAIQYDASFYDCRKTIFQLIIWDIFLIFAPNIDCC